MVVWIAEEQPSSGEVVVFAEDALASNDPVHDTVVDPANHLEGHEHNMFRGVARRGMNNPSKPRFLSLHPLRRRRFRLKWVLFAQPIRRHFFPQAQQDDASGGGALPGRCCCLFCCQLGRVFFITAEIFFFALF